MYVNEAFWTVDTMFYSVPKKNHLVLFAFLFLIRIDLSALNTGSAVPSMTTEVLNKIQIVIPTEKILEKFDFLVKSLYDSINRNSKETFRLEGIRDLLLPKLMSGEIKV